MNAPTLVGKRRALISVACSGLFATPGTAAAAWEDDVPAGKRSAVAVALEALQEGIAAEINAPLLGQEVEVLVDGHRTGAGAGAPAPTSWSFLRVTPTGWARWRWCASPGRAPGR